MLAACHTDQMSDNTISAELMDIEFMNNQAYSLAQASACERKSGDSAGIKPHSQA